MGYASHKKAVNRKVGSLLNHANAATMAWKRTVGGLVAQAGGRIVLSDEHAESVGPTDRLQVDRDEANKTTVFTLIRGGSDV